jgi:hypothetical protein
MDTPTSYECTQTTLEGVEMNVDEDGTIGGKVEEE